jgi:hypothetical protein
VEEAQEEVGGVRFVESGGCVTAHWFAHHQIELVYDDEAVKMR